MIIPGITTIPKAAQQQRQYAGFTDVDDEFASKADFEAAIQSLARIPDGWMAFCAAEKKWFQADKVKGLAIPISSEDFEVITENEAGVDHPSFTSAREAILWMLANGTGGGAPGSTNTYMDENYTEDDYTE